MTAALSAAAPTMMNAASQRSNDLWDDVEAEHHPALVVLGDVAVRHPPPGVRDVEQDVDGLTGPHQHGVLPDEIAFEDTVPGEDQEAHRPVHVERVMHRVVARHLVERES